MSFINNVLPTDASYYTLVNASITNDIMSLSPGGMATIVVDKTMLSVITEKILIRMIPQVATDRYIPGLLCQLQIITESESYGITVSPTYDNTGTISAEFDLAVGEGTYTELIITWRATEAISLLTWELCPEYVPSLDETIIEGVKQSLPKLLSDYNTWTIKAQQEENIISLISCYLQTNTDLQGHFSMDLDSSEYCIAVLRFLDSDMTELFAPMQFTLSAGHNSITVPHSYTNRLAGVHNFVVTIQCTNGTLTMYPRDILFTIDGGHLAKRLIDIGIDMIDLSIGQFDITKGPEEIWALGLENGEALLRSRKYDETNTDVVWTPQYSFGQALGGGLEFNGDWVRGHEDLTYTLLTDVKPHVFLIKSDHSLVVLKAPYETAVAFTLSINVTQCSVCRGYKSNQYLEQDQGLICAYVRDHKAYYRQYAYNTASLIYAWTNEVQLGVLTDIDQVTVTRLNDYRISFAVSGGTNTWYITDRTYVGSAVAPEYDTVYAEAPKSLISVHEATLNTYGTKVELVDPTLSVTELRITYDKSLYWYDNNSSMYFEEPQTIKNQVLVTVADALVPYDVALVDNEIVITFNPSISHSPTGNVEVVVDIQNDEGWLYIKPDSTHYVRIDSETLSWTLVRPIVTINSYVDEVDSINPNISSTITQRPILTIQGHEVELETVNDIVTTNIQQKLITVINGYTEETETVTNNVTSIITAIQTGSQPV